MATETNMESSWEGMDDLDSAEVVDAPAPKTFLDAQIAAANTVPPVKCYSCGGSGKFYSKFSGRMIGECFSCHGTGTVTARAAKTRATRKANEVTRAREAADQRAHFLDANQDVVSWIRDWDGRNDFATSLSNQLAERGSLSNRQLEAVRNNISKAAQRAQERADAAAKAEPQGNGLDISAIPEGRYAVPDGDTRLKIMIKRPKPPSQWAGFIFVSDAAVYGQQTKYGRQAPGKTYSGKVQEALRAIVADPRAAMAAYGKLTGTCGVCGRPLEDVESVERGIGPICAERF